MLTLTMMTTQNIACESGEHVIDVYRGGILADWYVPVLILLTIILLMFHYSRKSSVQMQITFTSLSKRTKRTLICL